MLIEFLNIFYCSFLIIQPHTDSIFGATPEFIALIYCFTMDNKILGVTNFLSIFLGFVFLSIFDYNKFISFKNLVLSILSGNSFNFYNSFSFSKGLHSVFRSLS